MSAIHDLWGPYAAAFAGVVGLWGVLMAKRGEIPRAFYWALGAAITGLLAEVILGVALLSPGGTDPGDQHVFYGALIAVTFTFAYLYRSQFRRSPALYYGLLLLFAMGLAIRGIMTLGLNF